MFYELMSINNRGLIYEGAMLVIKKYEINVWMYKSMR